MKKRSSQAAAIGLSAITIATLTTPPLEVAAAENSDSSVLVPNVGAETSDVSANDVASGIADLASNVSSSNTSKGLVDSANQSDSAFSEDTVSPTIEMETEKYVPEDEAAAEDFWNFEFPYHNAEVNGQTGGIYHEDLDKEDDKDGDDNIGNNGAGDGANGGSNNGSCGGSSDEIDDEIDDEPFEHAPYEWVNDMENSELAMEIMEEAGIIDKAQKIDKLVNQADESLEDAAVNSQKLAKSDKAMDEADGDVDTALNGAAKAADDAKSVTDDAKTSAEGAIELIASFDTTKDIAEATIAEAEQSVEKAEEAFKDAEENYEKALEDYEQAQADYEIARQAYLLNKEKTASDLKSAKEAFEGALRRLSDLEKRLSDAQDDLIQEGTKAVLAAEASKDDSDVVDYVSALIQHYCIPAVNGGYYEYPIQNFTATVQPSTGIFPEDCIHVKYDIVEPTGTRTVEADYGYVINSETGQVQIYRANLFYWYKDAVEQYHFFTPYEAEKYSKTKGLPDPENQDYTYGKSDTVSQSGTEGQSDTVSQSGTEGQSETPSGYNTPTTIIFICEIKFYTEYGNISSIELVARAKDGKVDFSVNNSHEAGSNVNNSRKAGSNVNNSRKAALDNNDEASVGGDWTNNTKVSNNSWGNNSWSNNSWGNNTASFSYAGGIQQDKVVESKEESLDISQAESQVTNNSRGEVAGAVRSMETSRSADERRTAPQSYVFEINGNQLSSGFIKYGGVIVTTGSDIYKNFVNAGSRRLNAYNNLMNKIADARAEYENAAKQLETLQKQIEDLEKANDTQAIVRLAELQDQLDKAKEDFDTAKTNLVDAKEALDIAKTGFEERFKDELPSVPAFEEEKLEEENTDLGVLEEFEELEEEEDEEVEEEVEELQEEVIAGFVPSGGPSRNHNYGQTIPLVQEIVSGLEDFVETKPEVQTGDNKPKESKKETITKAGMKERLPWFVGLGTVSTAGAGVAAFEAKRRAAMKILDKLNQ